MLVYWRRVHVFLRSQGTFFQEQLPKHLRSVKVHFRILRIYPAGPDHPQICCVPQKKGSETNKLL